MRLAIATPLYPPDIGGPATDAYALATRLKKEGSDVRVVTFGSVRTLPRVVRHVRYLTQLIRESKGADAIVAFDTVSVGVPAAIVARLRRIPLLVRVPGDYAWEQGRQRFGVTDDIETFQHTRYGMKVELLRLLQRFTVRTAELALAPSDHFAGVMQTWGIPASRIRRVYLGLPDAAMSGTAPEVEGKVMFSLGRFVPWKGFPLLISILTELPDWKLVLAGDGPLRSELEAQAQSLGVADRVTFLGSISHEYVMGWLRRADAFVYNTHWESFSFQVLEAMQVGASIITTKVGSLPELITDGVEGVLLQPDDALAFIRAIQSITDESVVWEARRKAAQERSHRFSIERSTGELIDLINHLCGSSS